MKMIFHPQGKFTKVEDGVYVDEKGNHYHDEAWQLDLSQNTEQNAMINRDCLEQEEHTPPMFRYIVKDEGKETTIKRLIW